MSFTAYRCIYELVCISVRPPLPRHLQISSDEPSLHLGKELHESRCVFSCSWRNLNKETASSISLFYRASLEWRNVAQFYYKKYNILKRNR